MCENAGIININKPTGVTSFWVVKQIKRILGIKKVGHCGTLDPLADGVLVVLFGKATKFQQMIMGTTKIYKVRFRLGITTDTGDITGKIIGESKTEYFSINNIREILNNFIGEIEQIPPMYSALKYKGQKLYKLARAGLEVERIPRKIVIYKIDLLKHTDKYLDLRVECSKGTYIRTLGTDIGKKIGCGATVEYLCREKVGSFDLDNALDGCKLNEYNAAKILKKSISVEQFLEKYKV